MADLPPAADGTVAVRLPEETVRGIAERIRGTAFDSVDAYVAFVLARLLEAPTHDGFSEDDERTLRERLRSLGYID